MNKKIYKNLINNLNHSNIPDGITLDKIKSNYIVDKIFEYIKINNFKLKLFLYSKYYQKKYGIINNYQEEWFIKYIDFFQYFECNKEEKEIKKKNFMKKYQNIIVTLILIKFLKKNLNPILILI